jgi:hypothetical protein
MHSSTLILLSLVALANVPSVLSASGPYVNSISPAQASKEGGTPVTVTGAGFEDNPDLRCKWTRVNPDTEQVIEKETQGTFKSATSMVCDSPSWDEATCPYCTEGSTCLASCANDYPWDNAEAHANVVAQGHYNAESNHHLAAGMGGARGKYPCPSCANEYDAHDNPNGQWPMGWKNTHDQGANQRSTLFYGHHGSRFLRTNSVLTPTEIGQGGFIKIGAQFFSVARISTCADGDAGCWCDGEWSKMQLATNNSGVTGIAAYPIGVLDATLRNNAMYEYDKNPGYWVANGHPPTCVVYGTVPADLTGLKNPDDGSDDGQFTNTGSWKAGTKIVLDQPLYKQGGTPNEEFWTNEVYVSSKKPCVDCKCAGGCPLTLTVTNNGRTYSGGGTNGRTWHGSAAKFTAKFVIPEVSQILFPGLEGTRDSSRMFVPATGNTRIQVKGKNFQEGPLLRCYFDTIRIMVKAEYIDSETVECQTPSFVARQQDSNVNVDPNLDNKCGDAFDSDGNLVTAFQYANDIYDHTGSTRLYDTQCTNSMQNGAAVFKLISTSGTEYSGYSFAHVQVTNNGKHADLSAVVHKRDDGARSYLQDEGNPHRSTCYQLPYPTAEPDSAVGPGYEQMEPCRMAHQDTTQGNDASAVFHQGNDVQVKYSTCYESLRANGDDGIGMDYYETEATDEEQLINATHALGQMFRIPADKAGPLVAVELHLIKAQASNNGVTECADTDDCEVSARQATTLEVCVSAGGFKGKGQTLACEWVTIQNMADSFETYTVYFTKAPYLLAYYDSSSVAGYATATHPTGATSPSFDASYYLTISHVSGPQTVSWATSLQSSTSLARPGTNGYFFEPSTNVSRQYRDDYGFRASFYTCDGCRWAYQSLQNADTTTYQVGKITGRQNQSDTYLSTHPSVTCKSTQTQSMGRSFANENFDTAEGLPRQNAAEDPTGVYADECGTPTYREQMAQAIRPLEDITVTKLRTKLASAYSPGSATHADRTASGDFVTAQGASVSVWITEHGKMGEHVCHTFTGTTQVSDGSWQNNFAGGDTMLGCGTNNEDCKHCDTDGDGEYNELCFVGAMCNKSLPLVYGGCGINGVCAMSNVVSNAHVLRNHPDGTGPFTSRCGEDADCDNSQNLKVQHSLRVQQATSASDQKDVIWEFETPVTLSKHTTYYVNMAIDEVIAKSDSVYWYAGSSTGTPSGAGRTPFLGSYTRTNVVVDGQMKFVWLANPTGIKFDLELMRCVTSLPSITSFSTSGAATGSCSARSSPRGGVDAPTITFKGKNLFPSANLRVVFLKPDGTMGPHSDCVSTRYDFTEMECQAPTFNPFEGVDCTVPDMCDGVHVMPTNDGVNYGPELFSPKFIEPYDSCTPARSPSYDGVSGGCDAVPASINASHHDDDFFIQLLGQNTLKYCFSDIYVSTSGNDYQGDGSYSRPFRTIQRGIDAANQNDVITMLPGTYTGTGNRGIRHMGKRIHVTTTESNPSSTAVCWCANGAQCYVKVGSSVLANPSCVGDKSYNAGTGISHRDVTVIDCENYADGFVLNNNKDSTSPFSGFVDFSQITTKNCENLRIYG